MLFYAFDYFWFKITTDKQWQTALKWLASIHISVAAIIVTGWPEQALLPLPFVIFLIGHIIWSFFTWILKEWALFALNLFFVGLDSYGTIIRIYK